MNDYLESYYDTESTTTYEVTVSNGEIISVEKTSMMSMYLALVLAIIVFMLYIKINDLKAELKYYKDRY